MVQKEEKEDFKKCRFTFHSRRWLHSPINKMSLIIITAFYIMVAGSNFFYNYGTLSTIEKLYKFGSQTTATLETYVDLGHLIVSFFISYFVSRGHKGRWFALAAFLSGLSCFIRTLPYFLFNDSFHGGAAESSTSVYYIFLISSFILGLAYGIYRSSGFVFLEENVEKHEFPFLSAVIAALGELGYSCGLIVTSYTLSTYVNLSPPEYINKGDPRWVGAWWFGSIPYGIFFMLIAVFLLFFPRKLKKGVGGSKEFMDEQTNWTNKVSVRDFATSIKRIFTSKIVLLDLCSGVLFDMSTLTYTFFYPKYTEIIFELSASDANKWIGSFSLVGKTVGVLTFGFCMSKFQPSARKLIKSSIIIQVMSTLALTSVLFLGCGQEAVTARESWGENGSENLTTDCNKNFHCEPQAKYSPVCDPQEHIVYASPCYAGCNTDLEEQHLHNCSCVPEGRVLIRGSCSRGDHCSSSLLLIFLIIMTFYQIVVVVIGHMKYILRFRYVEAEDKGFYIGLYKGISTLFGSPTRIIFGFILDYSCLYPSATSGIHGGNCWRYDTEKLRLLFNGVCISISLLAISAESILWQHVKGLNIYTETSFSSSSPVEEENEAVPHDDHNPKKLEESKYFL